MYKGRRRCDWTGGIYGDSRYYGSNSSVDQQWETVKIKGQLYNNLEAPLNASGQHQEDVGNNVVIRINVTTDNSSTDYQNASTVNVDIIDPEGSILTAPNDCSIVPEGNGSYNCTWNTTGLVGGNYTYNVTSSKDDYYNGTAIYTNQTLLVNTQPDGDNLTVDPSTGGWGRNYTFTVNVSDAQGDEVNCTLYVNTTGSFVYRGMNTLPGGVGNCTVNVTDFNTSDMGSASFRFELKDHTVGNVVDTTNKTGPTLIADAVQVNYSFGNESEVNRTLTGTTKKPLIVRFYDIDNESYVPAGVSGKIWVTTNGTDLSEYNNASGTNASGYYVYNFGPDCGTPFSPGVQNWTGGIDDNSYVLTNATENYTLTVLGTLKSWVIGGVGETTKDQILRGNDLFFKIRAKDDCNAYLSDFNVTFNVINRSQDIYYMCPGDSEGSGYYNCTENSSTFAPGWYNLSYYVNKRYFRGRGQVLRRDSARD